MTSAWTTSVECSMDNELHVLLTLLSLLAAVVQLHYACYNTTTAYTHRRQAIIGAICNYSTNCILLPVSADTCMVM